MEEIRSFDFGAKSAENYIRGKQDLASISASAIGGNFVLTDELMWSVELQIAKPPEYNTIPELVAKIDRKAKLLDEWKEITILRKLRNVFTHHNGVLKHKERDVLNYIQKTDGLSLSEHPDRIHIMTIDFLLRLMKKLVDYLDLVVDEIIDQKNWPPSE